MLKAVISSRDGDAFVTPVTIYIQTETQVNAKGMFVSIKQSKNQNPFDTKNQDYICLGKSVYINITPSIPATPALLQPQGEAEVKAFIDSLKLSQITSLDII